MKIQGRQFNGFITAILFLLLSCSQPPIVVPSQGQNPYQPGQPGQPGQGLPPGYQPGGNNVDPPPGGDDEDVTRRPPRRRRPVIRRPTRVRDRGVCYTEFGGDRCDEDDQCWELCFQMFHSRSEQDNCGRRPAELVDAFDLLLEDMQTGNVESVDGMVLQCLFQIDDSEFKKHLNRFSTKKAKAFLGEIGYKEDLAEAIFELDEDHDILEDLLEEAGFDDGWDFLTEEIDSRDTLIEIILEEDNEDAWLWLDNYVRLQCASDSTLYCGGTILDTIRDRAGGSAGLGEKEKRDAFTAYCKALRDDNNDYESFVESELFERDYEDFVVKLQVCCDESDTNKFDGTNCATRYDSTGERYTDPLTSTDAAIINGSACNKRCSDDDDCTGADTCSKASGASSGRCRSTRTPYRGKLKFNEAGLKEACRLACHGSTNDGDGACGQ